MRSPDDTPLRDGNRDRLMGILTDRCAPAGLHAYSLLCGSPLCSIGN